MIYNPVSTNPLRTRQDMENAAVQLLTPLLDKLSEGKARLHLGDSGAVYPDDIAEMEAFARPLWAIVPMLAGKCPAADRLWALWAEGLRNGTNPEHPEYWGDIGPYDQRMVEMAVIGMGLCLVPDKFYDGFAPADQDHIIAWLNQINLYDMPANNWRFFRILVNTGFRQVGRPYDQARLDEDFTLVENHYESDGWYYDFVDQREYYTMWAFHYYGLVYAKVMKDVDPERSARFLERGRLMAPRFACWFASDGEALPYGRSLTYRFAQGSFYAALALTEDVSEDFGYGEMKHLLLSNMRKWFSRPIFRQDGVLSIGYSYPNLLMAEGYNAPGSPYWAMKVFAVLALPEDHPFWQAEEKAYVCPLRFLEPHSRMLFLRDEQGAHVQAFTAGNHAHEHAHDEAKYEKFVYSTLFGFSVSKCRQLLAKGAFDSMLAVSDDGFNYQPRYGVERYEVTADKITSVWHPYQGVTIDSTILPINDWHIRIHRIHTDRPLYVADGGYAIRRETGRVPAYQAVTGNAAYACQEWGFSGILGIQGYDKAEVLCPEPNTNLLYSRTLLPTLTGQIPAGDTVLISAVLGAATDGQSKWLNPPKEEINHARMG